MIAIQVHVKGLDALRANFSKAPGLTLKYLAKATSASIFEVEKESIDRNFQFVTPRAQRTGQLQQSFAHGRRISPSGLSGSIGPTVRYAPYVYYGYKGRRPNKYMDRIAKAAEPQIQKHFEKAVDIIVTELSKQ